MARITGCIERSVEEEGDSPKFKADSRKVDAVPPILHQDFQKMVLESMFRDWEKAVSVLKYAIVRSPKRSMSSRYINFGHERVKIDSQSFKSFYINMLLRNLLFGPTLRKLKREECVWKTSRCYIVHVASS